jgi:hypothetical protein
MTSIDLIEGIADGSEVGAHGSRSESCVQFKLKSDVVDGVTSTSPVIRAYILTSSSIFEDMQIFAASGAAHRLRL